MGLQRTDSIDPSAATPGKLNVSYPTPQPSDLVVRVVVPIRPQNYEPLPLGTPYPGNDDTGLDLRLVWQGPAQGNDAFIAVQRVYASSRTAQDVYNYAIQYSGEGSAYPIYIRTTLERREEYTPTARDTPLTRLIGVNVTAGGSGYSEDVTATVTGGGGTGATLKPIVDQGRITRINITATGAGYTSTPTILIAGTGSGATAVAVIQPQGAVLVKEEVQQLGADDPLFGSFVRVVRVFETLPGPILSTDSDTQSGYEQIPAEFRQNDDVDETVQRVAPGTIADAPTGNILSSVVKQISLTVWEKTNRILVPGTAPTFTDKITNQFKQLVTSVRRLITTGSSSATPSATVDVELRDLGNGKTVEKVETAPSLFSSQRYEAHDASVPSEYVTGESASSQTVAGQAGTPTAPTGGSAFEENATVFTKRTGSTTPTLLNSLTEYETSGTQQVVSRTRTRGGTVGAPSATRRVAQRSLPGGHVETIVEDESLFDGQRYEARAPSVPSEYVTGESVSSHIVEGQATTPTALEGGSASEENVTVFTKRISSTTPTLLNSLTEYETSGTRQLVSRTRTRGGTVGTPSATRRVAQRSLPGGHVETIIEDESFFDGHSIIVSKPNPIPERFRASQATTIDVVLSAGTSISTPSLASSEFRKAVSRENAFVIRTETESLAVSSLPVLSGQEYNRRYGFLMHYTERVSTAGAYTDNPLTDVTPLSSDYDLVKIYVIPTTEIEAFAWSAPGDTINIALPAVLESLTVVWETASGDGNSSESGSAIAVGDSYNLYLKSDTSAEGNASVMPELIRHISYPSGENIDTTDYYFFMLNPTKAGILSRLAALAGAVAAWPKFKETSDTIILVGQDFSARVGAAANENLSGSNSSASLSQSSGSSHSKRAGISIRAIELPRTIHAGITIGGALNMTKTDTVAAAVTIDGLNPTETITASAHGYVTPSSVAPTDPASIPTSGLYLRRSDVTMTELFGYALVRAQVFDASSIA